MERSTRQLGVVSVLLCLLIPGLLGGCSSAKAPTFRVTGVQMRERNEVGTELLFQIEASNPNGKEIPLYEAVYGLSLGGTEVFRATRTPETTLRRYSTQTFVLPVAIGADRMPSGDRIPYSFGATVTYIMPGALAEILFDREIRKPKASFQDSGTLDFSGAGVEMSAIDPAGSRPD